MLRKPNTCIGFTNRNDDGTFSISRINPINEKAITREPNKKEYFKIKLICLFTSVLNLDLIN
jgi:hypothetical protein